MVDEKMNNEKTSKNIFQQKIYESNDSGLQLVFAFFDEIDIPIYAINLDTFDILFGNRMIKSLFSLISNQKCYEIFHGLSTPCQFCPNLQNRNRSPYHIYHWEYHHTLIQRWIKLSEILIIGNHSEKIKIGIAKDITEERKTYQIITKDPYNIDLLIKGITHDFKNLISIILGNSQLLLLDETIPERCENLQSIISASIRASELSQKILDFGKKKNLCLESVNVNDLIHETYSILKHYFPPNIQIELILFPVSNIMGDSTQLSRVLMNLCLNAKDAMPEGGKLLIKSYNSAISGFTMLLQKDIPENFIEIHICDTGKGIPPAVQSHIFEPFYSTKKDNKESGLGIGLTNVSRIVENHHGVINFTSSENKGTIFILQFPKFPNSYLGN